MFNPFLGVMMTPSRVESRAERFIFLDATDQSLCTVWLFNKQRIDLALDSLFCYSNVLYCDTSTQKVTFTVFRGWKIVSDIHLEL